MRKLNFLLLLVFLFSVNNIHAAETEPNNTKAQANALPANGNETGTYNNGSDVDWWALTTTDGDLSITIGVLNCTSSDDNCTGFSFTVYADDGITAVGSSTKTSISLKGLIAGTYYVVVTNLHTNEVGSTYTLYTNLISSTNDAEPNNDFTHALGLPLNGGKVGTVGYSNPLKRDSSDWYKITTNADGLVHFTFTASKTSINLTLFDNNGTTQIAQSSNSTNGTFDKDGLAAGTYYVKVKCYNVSVYSPYTINNTLIKPAEQNDTEPNDSKSQAKTLPLNGGKEGHVGYYYNLKRDSSDWYKLITTADGYLKFKFISVNTSINITLYNKDGITQIAKSLNSTNGTLNYDGLSAGNYFVKVQCYNNAVFTPYTLTDSLITYDYASDEEPNANPYQAKTILANGVTTGHTGFYTNDNTKDSVDWHKINYTGSGALSFTVNQEPYKSSGGRTTMHFYVYKDTAASTVYSGSSSAATFTANLTGLTQGYYWIKINSYDYVDHVSYSFTNSFTQVTKAKANILGYDTAATCSNTNYIKVKPGNGNGPFSVILYRFGVSYSDLKTVKKGGSIEFDNLPTGSYYAIVYADGATGDAFGKSVTVMIEPTPAGTTTQNIKTNKATFTWTKVDCAAYYTVKYRKQGATTWTSKETNGNINSFQANNLKPNTTYEWIVATADSANNIIAKGEFTESVLFTTAASALIAENKMSEDDAISVNGLQKSALIVSPNPATNFFIINLKNNKQEKVNAILFDMNGKTVWTSGLINSDALNGKKVMVNQFGNGVYYLRIINAKGVIMDVAKLMINK